ncbi:MAG: rhomboid family intramembrane serine protease [Legionellaceae bacterium]|nr:rhomboid family intramembrane serine protease [Legionellaceae bacterium]HAF86996.1 rhomboid family intramembrane serine protease [Legionellales bacterium]HCA89245.1 rhomboid family intramembrane serine protease [Legionellales bacterium]|tara:strand:+ start:4446 stop:5048 length:603 start_codon:yes stop_codon:yes gene_type:complete
MFGDINQSLQLIVQQTQQNLSILGYVLLLPWSAFVLNILLAKRLLWLGIFPRRLHGMFGIVCAPLLHANFNHIFFNSIPLVVLSDFLLIEGLVYFLSVTIFITLLSGFLIWCVARPGLHVGASALITGYWGFLVINMYHQTGITTFILGILSLYYFAGIFFGIFPSNKGYSWEGHLCGLIAGISVNYLLPTLLTFVVDLM